MGKYKICLVTLCKNESSIIPFCVDYWKRLGITKAVVWDNESEDNSVELLSKEDWIEIRTFKTAGQTETVQKKLKEDTYLEFKDQFDIIILCDFDEVFYFNDFEAVVGEMIDGGYDCMITPIYSLCEDSKPLYEQGKYLHQLCHKFYKQRMNHMKDFEDVSKISIFNCHTVEKVSMSVGQHYVQTFPKMQIIYEDTGFNLHIDKGFGIPFKWEIRQRMNKNLSEENKKCGFCVEYADSYEKLKQEYEKNQKNSFDINKKIPF